MPNQTYTSKTLVKIVKNSSKHANWLMKTQKESITIVKAVLGRQNSPTTEASEVLQTKGLYQFLG